MPLTNWCGRFHGVGGGGWATSSGADSLLSPVSNGDGGYVGGGITESWWRDAQGSLNIPLLEDFASVALNDLAVLGKQRSTKLHNRAPHHSYWNGCSTLTAV